MEQKKNIFSMYLSAAMFLFKSMFPLDLTNLFLMATPNIYLHNIHVHVC